MSAKKEAVCIIGLFLFLGLAVWQDCRRRRISNLLVSMAFLMAVLYQIVQHGFSGIFYYLFQAGFITILLFPLFLCEAVGAGDIKLLATAAVFLSWRHVFLAFLWGLYLSLIPIFILLIRKKKLFGCRIPLSGALAAGILIVLCKEGHI